MKRNFVVGIFGGLIGSVGLFFLLSAAGIVGARGADVARSGMSHVNTTAAATLTSTFTYQGQLINSGSPVSSTCDFQFSLYDALSAGNRIGITQTVSGVSVSRGLFTALLNVGNEFGDTAFNGEARWLSIAVACPTGSSYTPLSPLQPLTSLPFALPGLRTFPNATSPNIVGGFSGNSISSDATGSAIGGGGQSGNGYSNTITNSYAFIGGGYANIARGYSTVIGGGVGNQANGDWAAISGGNNNKANGSSALVGGGVANQANGLAATVDGGYNNQANGPEATVGGGVANQANGLEATVGGGISNTASFSYTTVGGGYQNTASNPYATIGGGEANTASGNESTISGGYANAASGFGATLGGGEGNNVTNTYATVGGGYGNTAGGQYATVSGGSNNSASGNYSFAAGRHAKAIHQGAFVWADSINNTDFASTANYQFLIRANGGVGINSAGPFTAALSVNGQIVAGGIVVPNGSSEPFVSTGGTSGISMDDRNGGVNPRWVIYPQGRVLGFYNSITGTVVTINGSGKVTANGGFNGQCLNGTNFNVTASSSCNMDVAEAFGSSEQTEPGDLVTLVTEDTTTPTVHKSSQPYAGLLVGVVSQNPGLIFDNGQTNLAGDNSKLITADKTVVALVGRVQVKVSMENGFIAIGDPLTSSSTPGVAMKATRAGKIVGYAMGIANANGTVLALVQPGYYLPSDQLATQTDSAPTFNWFNLLSVIAFAGFATMWLQQRRSKRGQA